MPYTRRAEAGFWYWALATGSIMNMALFLALPRLGYHEPPVPPPVMIVDFMEWQPPAPRKKEEPPPKPEKPKPRPKPKQVLPPKTETPPSPPEVKKPVLTETVAPEQQEVSAPPVVEEKPEPLPEPVPIYQVQTLPRFVHKVVPEYPAQMQALGREALVKVEALIDARGRVRQVTVVKSGGELFDRAALEAVRRCSFEPAYADGRPVPVLYRIPVPFVLK